MTDTGCTCPEPGWCERHKCTKTASWHKLCQTRPDYFALWEDGRGPGQSIGKEPPVDTRPKDHRVGRELCRILGCKNGFTHVTELNDWGPDGCEERLETIIVWMHEAAEKRESPMSDEAARRILLQAIKQSRKFACQSCTLPPP